MAYQLTIKGQVTIPKKVRDYLGIGPGSGVEFELDAAGSVLLRKAGRPGKRIRARSAFATIRGTRKTGMRTDAVMELLRGYSADERDPGFSAGNK
jgi:antitoxin PrlF